MRVFTYFIIFLALLIPLFAQADNPLNSPKQLSQNFSDCQTSILPDQWIQEDAVCLKAKIFGRRSGELVKLEAEIIPIDEDFSDVPNYQASQFCASPCNSNISINQLSNGQRYHWQVRTINERDEVSDWVEFSSSQFAFGVDQTPPQGTIIASSEAVRVGEKFKVTVGGQDNIAMKYVCYREENDSNWTCYRCSEQSSECEFSFSRSESSLQKYKYYGYLMDAAGQGNFTEPEEITVSVQTDPAVATLAVTKLSGNQATFAGYVTDLGQADEVEVWFEYQSSENDPQTSDVLLRRQTGAFQISVDNLDPHQVYRLRPVIKNGVGLGYGQEIMSTELIANGYFETGTLDGWQTAGPGHYSLTKEAYRGEYSGLFGFKDYKGQGTSSLFQNITIPQEAGQINLSFAYNFYTYDYCGNDAFRVRLRNTQGDILETYEEWCCPSERWDCRSPYQKVESGWKNISRDLKDYAGQTVLISFEVWRRDSERLSWAVIDNVSLTYVPITPPTVSTLAPEDVHTGSVTMVGDLIDNGQDESTQVWFVWDEKPGQDWQDYAYHTGSLTPRTEGEFVISIGNFLSDTTYYFRAVAKNNAGLSLGEEKTFTTLYATAGGWRLPDYHVDVEDRWSYEEQAYDWDTATRAKNDGVTDPPTDWRGYLEFHLNQPILCSKIRISGTGEGSGSGDTISEIYIRYFGEEKWRLVFKGVLPENHRFIELDGFPVGLVESARVRRKHPANPGGGAWVSTIGEFHFYEVPDEPITEPTVHTLEAVKIESNSVILKGRISDDGGELVETRFKYWTEDNPDQIYYTEWDQGLSGETNGWATGEVFGRMVAGLEEGKSYGFKAQARNSVSSVPAEGDSKIFTTRPAPVGWVSPTDSGGTWGGYEHYGYDDILGTYTSINRSWPSSPWSPWLDFSRPGLFSDRIRFRLPEARSGNENIIQSIQIRIIIDGQYQEVYNSGDFKTGEWVEVDISSRSFDSRGNPLVVEGASLRMQMTGNHYFPFEFDELEFWKLPESPEVLTGSAQSSLEDNELKVEVSGELTYFGGVEEAEAWFEWRKDNEKYQDRNRTDPITLTKPGSFWAEIGHKLDRGSSYYFRAAARNEFITAYGSEERFLTNGCLPGQETECVAYEEGNYVCRYTVDCQDDGLWARCDPGNCALDEHCHCTDYLEPKLGYEITGSAFCGEDCLCDYSQCQYSGAQPSAINLKVAEPDYCYWDPSAIFSWEFIGPEDSEQTAYRLQVSQRADFATLVVDSGVISSGSDSYAVGENILDYKQSYYWRLMVWDASGDSSSWISGPTLRTPRHRYPRIDFTWEQVDTESGKAIRFKDQSTVFNSVVTNWFWEFEDGNPDSVTGQPNPVITFTGTGNKNVVLAVTDSSGYFCQGSKTIDLAAQTIPGYKEVPPVE